MIQPNNVSNFTPDTLRFTLFSKDGRLMLIREVEYPIITQCFSPAKMLKEVIMQMEADLLSGTMATTPTNFKYPGVHENKLIVYFEYADINANCTFEENLKQIKEWPSDGFESLWHQMLTFNFKLLQKMGMPLMAVR